MIALALILGLIVGGLGVYMIRRGSGEPLPDLDPEAATKAAIELHAIRRRLDVAWTRTELRRDSTRLRRLMADELDDTWGSEGR